MKIGQEDGASRTQKHQIKDYQKKKPDSIQGSELFALKQQCFRRIIGLQPV